MSKLDKIKKYSEALRKASQWKYSKEAISNIASIKSSKKKKEYIYEFYCLMRIIDDLLTNHTIEVIVPNKKVVFPKAPASKSKYPYFLVKDKLNLVDEFQICVGIEIIGNSDETDAPDISFQKSDAPLIPKAEHVFMIFDSKFKHKLNGNVSKTEFANVSFMVKELECENATRDALQLVKFNKFKQLYGNCILSNGRAYKKKLKIHQKHNLMEVEFFDEGTNFNVIG